MQKHFFNGAEVVTLGRKIGLIGRAAAHFSDEVPACAKKLGITVELLHAGMTAALMQPCDIWRDNFF